MSTNGLANAGIVTQLAMVHTMLPKVKELIDSQVAEIEALHRFIDERGETGQLIIWKTEQK
jgi:molybdopterin/thiamine biosynthesis adenylyltransferase